MTPGVKTATTGGLSLNNANGVTLGPTSVKELNRRNQVCVVTQYFVLLNFYIYFCLLVKAIIGYRRTVEHLKVLSKTKCILVKERVSQ